MKKLRKLVAWLALASFLTGLFPLPTFAARFAVRDIKASLNFSASSDKVDAGTDFIGTGNVTVCGWIKPTAAGGGGAGRIFDNGSTSLAITTSSGVPRLQASNDGGTTTKLSAAASLTFNSWQFICYTRSSAKLVNFRINGAASGTADQDAGTIGAASTNTIIGNKSAGSFQLISKLSRLRVFNRILTIAEQDALYYGIDQLPSDYKTSMVAEYLSSEGAGTTLNDTSGNGHNGTITGATFVSDTPSKARSLVNPNLVKNGDFEYAPPFVAGTNTASRWIDGTAGGSTVNSIFNWSLPSAAILATANAGFDSSVSHSGSNSMRLSTLDATGVITVQSGSLTSPPSATDIGRIIYLLPSTSYTLTGWVRTNNCASNSAFIDVREYSAALTTVTTNSSNKLSGTNAWTQVSVTFTTNASTRYATILLRNNVAGNISDAWFDDIVLTPTTAYQTQNLLQYTQSFDNAYWTKTRASIPASYVTDPFGGTNAQIIHEDNTAGATHVAYRATPGFTGLMTASLYVKASNRSWIALAPNGSSVARYFNVFTGTIGSGGGDLSYGMQYAGNGWYRCWITYISDGSHLYYYIASASGTVSFNGLDQDSLYIYGAQVERGAQMTPYRRIDATPYNPNGRSIIAQQQNLLAYSEAMNAGLTASAYSLAGGLLTVADNQYANPVTGATTMSKLTAGAGTQIHALLQTTTYKPNTTYTLSGYVKYVNNRWVALRIFDGVNTPGASFDLVNGVKGTLGSGVIASITQVASGVYFIQMTATTAAGAGTGNAGFALNNSDTAGLQSWTAAGTENNGFTNFQLVQANWAGPYKATTLTPFNENGVRNVVAQAQNLIYPSQDFNTRWAKSSNITISSADTIAPDGTQTADTATVNTTAYASVSYPSAITINKNGTYTLSFWVKAGTTNAPYFGIYDGSTWVATSQNAQVISGPGSVVQVTGSLYSVTGLSTTSWTRVSVTRTGYTGNSAYIFIYPDNSSSGTAGHSIKLWGAQFVQANWAGPYTPTTASVVNIGNIRNIVY